jgi:hypothetical protein
MFERPGKGILIIFYTLNESKSGVFVCDVDNLTLIQNLSGMCIYFFMPWQMTQFSIRTNGSI